MTTTTTKTSAAIDDDRKLLLRIVEEAYRQNTWNGTNLRSSLEHVSAAEADWQPPHARHTIAEIVLHAAYWKFAIRKRMTGDRRAAFPLEGKDWFEVSGTLEEERWAELVGVLDEEHRRLAAAIEKTQRDLDFGTSAGRELVRKLFGVAMHDAYHTGQIHLIQAQYQRALKG
jgi:hypothetical protein